MESSDLKPRRLASRSPVNIQVTGFLPTAVDVHELDRQVQHQVTERRFRARDVLFHALGSEIACTTSRGGLRSRLSSRKEGSTEDMRLSVEIDYGPIRRSVTAASLPR
jgi:hypothetical protein